METQPKKRRIDWARYIITFIITAAIFGLVIYLSNLATDKRFEQIKSFQDKISLDLLSSETQFSLLNDSECDQNGTSILAPEIGEMGERLSYMESQLGTNNADVIGLKKYYSLLEIKDYLLAREFAKQCAKKPITIVYFYKNEDCADCTKQGYVLTALRDKYPDLRVYSFDAGLDLSAIATLRTVTKAPDTVPSLVINGKVYAGMQSIEDIEKILAPELKKLEAQKKLDAQKAVKENPSGDQQ